jgi:acetyl-CoA C-acetyltransferase
MGSAVAPEAFIVDAVRTPVGRRNGGLSAMHPADLAAHALKGLVERTGIDPGAVDDVILGCLECLGPQAGNVARTAWLAAGLPESVPGTTIDRQCGSAQQAVHFAAMGVMSGVQDLVVAGGVQQMSMIPIGTANAASDRFGQPDPWTGAEGWARRYGLTDLNQFKSADMIAERWSISRDELEEFSAESHGRALRAQSEGRFDNEILPVGDLAADEGPREPNLEKMRSLPPLVEGGVTTAAMASQISDAAAVMLIAGERALEQYGLTPRARIHHLSVLGDDPIIGLTAPIAATAAALNRTGLAIDDIDRIEINEAFASVVVAWLRETKADPARVNVNGGAIALGHPLGATGARLMITLLGELERTGGRYGLQTMCEGGGTANVTIIERL